MSEEARTGKRFPLELPIKIHGKKGDEGGTTANMSAAGVYIMADLDLSVGSPIEFDITLPAQVLGTPGDVEVRCSGRVVRKEASQAATANSTRKKKKNGIACVIDQYKFIRKEKGRK
ncbi:MAG TPA: PilZ domain-containing protein [Candidatus Angelobacter sp.]|jgi:PilZ domain|nr:PilZ domain-containing protein [Candidatus Angelobacter sp.]HKT48897.1 PilZ domain-containing protein [Candidatus Angelobacter sp.]